jgi:hypothetical protein
MESAGTLAPLTMHAFGDGATVDRGGAAHPSANAIAVPSARWARLD